MISTKPPNQDPSPRPDFKPVEDEYKKLKPVTLDKAERISKKRFSMADQSGSGRKLSQPPEVKVEEEPSDKPEEETETVEVPVTKKASELSVFNDELLELDRFLLNKYHRQGYMFTPTEYYKILWALLVLHILGSVATVLLTLLAFFYFPASRFVADFQTGIGVAGQIIFTILFWEPIYAGVLYYVCCQRSRKKISVIRIYYVVGTWMLLLLFIALLMVVAFGARITEKRVHEELKRNMDCYDDGRTSLALLPSLVPINYDCQKSWDEIQLFYHCCGITKYTDWYSVRGFWDPGDEKKEYYWLVPNTCCKHGVTDVEKCTKYPSEHTRDIYMKSCFNSVVRLLEGLATAYGVIIFFNFCVQVMTIIMSSKYHEILRFEDGTYYKMSCRTFGHELFFLYCFKELKFKPTHIHYSQILPINATTEEIKLEHMKQHQIQDRLEKEEEEQKLLRKKQKERKEKQRKEKEKLAKEKDKGHEVVGAEGAKGSSGHGHGQVKHEIPIGDKKQAAPGKGKPTQAKGNVKGRRQDI